MQIEFHALRPRPKRIFRIAADPFYYAIRLPSVVYLIIVAGVFLGAISATMIAVWMVVRWASLGSIPDLAESPPKMFIGCAVVSTFTICAGIIHRRMTAAEIRGKFVSFSKFCQLDRGRLSFSVIDKRSTQLIGATVKVDIITLNSDDGSMQTRTVDLGSPGILVIPTEISVGVAKIFPLLATASSCTVCGHCGFSDPAAYAAHMSFFHAVAKTESLEELNRALAHQLDSTELFRVRIAGVDEVSGKPGSAEKLYAKSDFQFGTQHNKLIIDDTFSVISKIGGDTASETSSTDHGSPSRRAYVHVDFKYH